MTKLVQRRFLRGVWEFEIDGETIAVSKKSLFKEEKLTVDLSVLDSEPVTIGSELAFYNPHKGHPVFTLLLNKPSEDEFNRFIDALKQSISGGDESDAPVESVSAETAQSAMARNVYEEPPEFEDAREQFDAESVNVDRLVDDINMLKTYLDDERFNPLFEALEALRLESHNESAFRNVLAALNDLGVYQGRVLTYAPYLVVLVSKYGD